MSAAVDKEGLSAREIAALVPMTRLLQELGFEVNTRSHRSRCLLHGGANRSAFSWNSGGFWHCFSCQQAGDRIQLVRTMRKCSFREALEFLAAMAGVKVTNAPAMSQELLRRKKERNRLQRAAHRLAVLERAVRFEYRDHLHLFFQLREKAGTRLAALHRGEPERFPAEEELCWEALRFVGDNEVRAAAAYTFIAFASQAERAVFTLRPHLRKEMIEKVLARGFVEDEKGHIAEVVL